MIRIPAGHPRGFGLDYSEHSLIRGMVDSLFRNWKWLATLWIVATVAAAAYYFLGPREYETEMTFLVRNSRADVVVNPDGSSSMLQRQADVSDAQLSTEVEMLSSRAIAVKLLPYAGFAGGTDVDREHALGKLRRSLTVAPVVKSNMIRVRYTSRSQTSGVPLLDAMAAAYLEEHLSLRGSAGSYEFFDQQTTEAENRWKDAQKKLLAFEQTTGIVSGAEEKGLLLRRQIDLQVTLHQAEAELKETGHRIDSIRPRLDTMAARIETQNRHVPNQYSVERLNTMLTELSNRRTEMLSKYRATDRSVTQLDQQIADTTRALDDAQKRVSTEEQTDVNPLRQSLEGELAREVGAEAGLRGRIQTMLEQDRAYRIQLAKIDQDLPLEQQLEHDSKVAEENYLLYAKRREEARIGQRMDQDKIANVVLAAPPQAPVLPKSRSGPLLAAYLLALVFSVAVVAITARSRRTVNTPWDLAAITDAPVLGTVPVHRNVILPERMRGFS
ncbi:MAG TPA: Wzz/FepE/Etk N-terminal domain-containing protein [Bryobacteraceae bacterium]|jgi:uncharacterized protein involved in exopolysaccharide biosynthesis